MKRIYIATLTTALVLLSGCNKDDRFDTSSPTDNAELVRIELGGQPSLATTRASIESLDEVDGQLGIFCLARTKTNVKGSDEAQSPNWNTVVSTEMDSYGTTTNGIYWPNIYCDVVHNGSSYALEPVEGQHYYWYYPMTSWYGYDFYGYYPYQSSYKKSQDSVYVDMTINGTQDVIWGKSEVPNIDAMTSDDDLRRKLKECYYSARYFRFVPDNNVTSANMKFDHKLTRFRFFVYPGASKESLAEKKYDEAAALCVKELRLLDVEHNLRLVVADKSTKGRSGALYSRNSNSTNFLLHHKNGSLLSEYPVNITTQKNSYNEVIPDTAQLGDCIMVLPGHTTYHMSLVLADTANHDNAYASEKRITIARDASHTKPFEAGKTYNVYLQVSGVTKIGVTAELSDWVESGEDMDDIELQ